LWEDEEHVELSQEGQYWWLSSGLEDLIADVDCEQPDMIVTTDGMGYEDVGHFDHQYNEVRHCAGLLILLTADLELHSPSNTVHFLKPPNDGSELVIWSTNPNHQGLIIVIQDPHMHCEIDVPCLTPLPPPVLTDPSKILSWRMMTRSYWRVSLVLVAIITIVFIKYQKSSHFCQL
jgi:hypothetical protein